jgi:hypothetical protein
MGDLDEWAKSGLEALGQGAGFSVNGRATYGVNPRATDKVWLGGYKPTETKLGPGPYAPGYKPEKQNRFLDEREMVEFQDAARLPAQWDEKQLKDFVNKTILYKVPGASPDMGMPEILSIWDDMLKTSWAISTPEKPVTPWEILDSYAKSEGKFGTTVQDGWVIDLSTGKRIGYKGSLTKKTKRTEVNLTSPEEVHAIMNQALADALGRAPTDKELATFRASVSAMEAQRPQVSEVTTQLKPNLETGQLEEVSSSAVNSGGVSQGDIQQAAQEAAQRSPEYGKYQSGTTYFDAMMQMITGG